LPKGKQGFFIAMNTTKPGGPESRILESDLAMWPALRRLPRAAWILFFGTFLNKFGAFVVPFLTLYLTRQGYSLADAGMAIAAYGMGNFAACILGGYLADRIGRRKTIVLSMFSGAAAMLALSQAQGLPMIIALAALAGLTGELYRPASSALLADLVPPGQRVTAYSAYRMAFNAGWAFGPATAGLLATHGYFWLFVGDALTSFLFGIVALLALPRGVHSREGDCGWIEALRVFRRDRPFHQVLLAGFAIALVLFQMASTFGLQVTHLGFSAAVYGMIISLNGLLVVLFELPLTTITRRFAPRRVMAVGYLLSGIGFFSILFARTVPALVGCVLVFTLGEMIAMPVAGAYIADLAPASMRGRYMGVNGLTWALALTFGPAIGMRLFAIGPALLWSSCGGLALLATMIILRRVGVKTTVEAA
jgi:MFS family permease